jgi:hypothetical protein
LVRRRPDPESRVGAKQSGIGTEFAEEGLAEFTQLQIINEARA